MSLLPCWAEQEHLECACPKIRRPRRALAAPNAHARFRGHRCCELLVLGRNGPVQRHQPDTRLMKSCFWETDYRSKFRELQCLGTLCGHAGCPRRGATPSARRCVRQARSHVQEGLRAVRPPPAQTAAPRRYFFMRLLTIHFFLPPHSLCHYGTSLLYRVRS